MDLSPPPDRIQERFARNKRDAVGALLPYFTAGYPDAERTALLVREADARGASVVELGEPYSDSIADGPVIQESFHEALAAGHTVADTFELVAGVRPHVGCGLVSMVSSSIVYRFGLREYMRSARLAGFDGVILPDVAVEEAEAAFQAAEAAGLDYIGLVSPTTSPARIGSIVRLCTGFVYQVAEAGTTGERANTAAGLPTQVARLRAQTGLPICVGFGVSSAEHVREICRHADGAIVGSAIIRRIREQVQRGAAGDHLVAAIGTFLSELMTGVSR